MPKQSRKKINKKINNLIANRAEYLRKKFTEALFFSGNTQNLATPRR